MKRAALTVLALACISADASAFVRTTANDGTPIRWLTREIPWYLHERGSIYFSFAELLPVAQEAFKTWENAFCTDLKFPYRGTTSDERVGYNLNGNNRNVVRFVAAEDWLHDDDVMGLTTVTYCIETDNNLCPVMGRILDADMELNEGFHFTLGNEIQFDVQNTVTHEAGHMLGLDHSPESLSTMFASAPYGEISKRTLDQDDIDGICTIYPKGVPDPDADLIDNDGGGCQQGTRGRPEGGFLLIWALCGLCCIKKSFQL